MEEMRHGGITIRKCVPTLFELVIFHNVLGLVSPLLDGN